MSYQKLVLAGDFLEVYDYENSPITGRARKVVKRVKRSRILRPDNVRRRAKAFIRLVRSNLVGVEKPSLLTLTMFEIVGVGDSYKALTVFTQRLRFDFGPSFRFISVLEFQKRGAIHFHLICWGIPDNFIFNERNNRYFQRLWQRGFVDCLQTDGSPKLASYLSKYLSKSLSDERLGGSKAFSCSRNVLRPLLAVSSSILDYSEDLWGLDLSTALPLVDRHLDVQWLGKGRYRFYKLK